MVDWRIRIQLSTLLSSKTCLPGWEANCDASSHDHCLYDEVRQTWWMSKQTARDEPPPWLINLRKGKNLGKKLSKANWESKNYKTQWMNEWMNKGHKKRGKLFLRMNEKCWTESLESIKALM